MAVKGEAIMTKSHDHKPINFVGLYFIDEERGETGQIIAQISDGYYLAQYDSIEKGAPPPTPLIDRSTLGRGPAMSGVLVRLQCFLLTRRT